jgi:hypothetical protein
MKRKYFISTCFVFLSLTTFAQTSTQRVYIKGGTSAWENFMKEIFLYPSFEPGIVEYKNGQRFKSQMNYNKALGTIQFIDEKGDTLSMNNEESIAFINIGNDKFIYAPECLQIVQGNEKISLLKHEMVKIADKHKTGGYGIPNASGTIESIDRLDTRPNYNQIEINENLLIHKVTTFYIEDENGEIFVASRKNLLNNFPKKEEAIKSYIKANNVDLSKEDHLINLADFISKN